MSVVSVTATMPAGGWDAAPWRGVRTDRSMCARTEAGTWALYDLKDDPFESKNLAHDPAQAAFREWLDTKLAAWESRTADSWPLNSTAPVEVKGRLYWIETFYPIRE